MEDAFKERIAAALLGDLLVALAKREKIKEMLRDFEGWAADDLIRQLLDDFEAVIAQRRAQILSEETHATAPSPPVEPAEAPDAPPVEERNEQPFEKIFTPARDLTSEATTFGLAGELAESAREILGHSFPSTKKAEAPKQTPDEAVPEPVSPNVEALPGQPLAHDTPAEEITSPETPGEPTVEPEEHHAAPAPVATPEHRRRPYEFDEADTVYIHGAMILAPEELPSTQPFRLEERGIDDKDYAFAIDHRGVRFYLSKVHTRSSNISRTGLLLLSKQESIMMRSRHESILNELRAHGILLPFEFGTVARGKDELLEKIDMYFPDLLEAVDEIGKTTWWEVSLFALDARGGRRVQAETPARSGRDRGRQSYSSKVDIKSLERMLGEQKKTAEAVHDQLNALADRSDVDMKVGLGSGTSQDWKLILKASYEIPPSRFASFNRALIDIQDGHLMFDVMLAVAGERESFSFQM